MRNRIFVEKICTRYGSGVATEIIVKHAFLAGLNIYDILA